MKPRIAIPILLCLGVLVGCTGAPGGLPTIGAELFLSPTALDFGTTETQLSFSIQNRGQSPLYWTISGIPTWATVDPVNGTNNATVVVTIDRPALGAALGAGEFHVPLPITSNGGDSSVTLNVTSTLLEVIGG